MKNKFYAFTLLCCFAFFTGCAAQKSEPKHYAELRIENADKIQVLICGDYYMGLVGPDGFGGYRQDIYYWATLQGNGIEYTNFVFHENGSDQMAQVLLDTQPKNTNDVVSENAPILRQKYFGTITVDQKKKQVIIDLQRIISKLDKPQQTEPCSANGTYYIKRIIKKSFMTPE